MAFAALVPGSWLTASQQARATTGQPGDGASAQARNIQLPYPRSVARPLEAYLQDRPMSVKDFGAIGDYNPATGVGADDTAAIQAAINAMATGPRDASPSVLIFPMGYYKITASLAFPFGFQSNTVDLGGSRIYYRGPASATAAIFKITKNQFTNNTLRNGHLWCEGLCGYGLYIVGEGNLYAISTNVVDTFDIHHPAVRAIQFGDYSNNGLDMDGACWTFRSLRLHLKNGQGGIVIDAPDVVNTSFMHNFWGGWGNSAPQCYLQVKNALGVYIFDLFTGDNAAGVFAIEINDSNVAIVGWTTEGTELLKMKGMVGERRNVYVANLVCNDSVASATATYAIYAPDGELTLDSATLGKANIHPRKIYCGDRLCATNVYLGSNADASVIGSYILDHPDRCVIEGKPLLEVRAINGNPQFDLWRGHGRDDLPWGYDKSPLGACTVMRDATAAHLLNGPFVAKVVVMAGGMSNYMCDGLIAKAPINFIGAGTRNVVAVVRGKVMGLRGTSTVNVRLRFADKFGNRVDSVGGAAVTPDAEGHFLAFITARPVDNTAITAEIGVGLGVAGASGTIYVQTVHLLRYDPYTVNGGENWRVIVDAWTKYPAQTNPIEEYARCGVTAHYRGGELVRQWLGSAPPTSGACVRGDIIWNDNPAAANPPGWMCVASGAPGSWKPMADLGR